jgi:hypothetical protein
MPDIDQEHGDTRPDNPYPLPLYLNQKYVFDVLSMMERGFTQLETVTERRKDEEETGSRLSGGVGFSNVFGLLNVSFGAGRARRERSEGDEEVSSERVHTPNSLFARMRERLYEERLVQSNLASGEPAAAKFVETRMRLEKNPLVESIETMLSILRLATIFEDRGSGGGRGQRQGQRSSGRRSENEQLLSQMNDFLTELNSGEIVDLLATPMPHSEPNVVLTLDMAYAIDRSLSDLIDGEYNVLGKVTRFIPEASGETINLLRKTTLGRVHASLLEQLRQPLQEIQASGLNLPEFKTEIAPPVIQILPIAVFA